jgi:sodium/potassium-transporting ATPase subunit alpha
MHVENVAILDVVYNSESFRTSLPDAGPDSASNLAQVAAIGAICNAATFDYGLPGKTDGKGVSGNATGDFFLNFIFLYWLSY